LRTHKIWRSCDCNAEIDAETQKEREREREDAEKRAQEGKRRERGSDAPQGASPFEVTGVFYLFTAV